MGKIDHLIIENFKSYKGSQKIGPFRNFQSIIGPNGAGKSNLMDAISFVLGVKTTQLRGANLADLIYKPEGAQLNPNTRCSIQLIYTNDDDTDTIFERRITQKTAKTDYLIDRKVVSKDNYIERLKDIGILVKARNFLVFQGEVEAIASKTPKELTQMIEQISGSDELKEEYDALLREKNKAEETTIYNYQKKKGINAEKKQYKIQKKEAEDFQKLLAQKADLQRQHILWQLFHIEKNLDSHNTERIKSRKALSDLQSKLDVVENQLREKKKEQAKAQKEVLTLERRIRELVRKEEESKPDLIKLGQELQRVNDRLGNSKKSLEKVNAEYERHEKTVADLERQLREVEKAARDFEAEEAAEITQISFSEDQIADYHRRKEQVYNATAKDQQEMNQLNRQQKQDKEAKESLENKMNELDTRKRQLEGSLDALKERKEKMTTFVATNVQKQMELQGKLNELQQSNKTNAIRQNELTEQLEKIQDSLREAKSDVRQTERDIRFRETLESLKRLFPGVHGTMTDVCKPTQSKYNIAITVAMGANMDAIIVDDEKTATECIRYMKEQRAGTATFIPLDKIKVRPINDKYRLMGNHVKPILDVIQFDAAFQKAVLYAVGNTLVCDTIDEARRIGFNAKERNKVVTLNGVLIHKSGLMTGGLSGIESRAGRWNEKQIEELKRSRDKYLRELTEIGRSLRSVDLEQQLISQIAGLENRIKYSNVDMNLTQEKIDSSHVELRTINEEISRISPDLRKLQSALDKREDQINTVAERIHETEDRVFADFCRAVGVDNIREYEETQLKQAQERMERKVKLAAQQSRLATQLEYERNRDIRTPKETLENSIENDEKLLRELKDREKVARSAESKFDKQIDTLRQEQQEFKSQVEEHETEVKRVKSQLNAQNSELHILQRKVTNEETSVEQLKDRRHNLLQKSRVEEIHLPRKSSKSSAIKKRKRTAGAEEEEEEAEAPEEEEEEEEDVEEEAGEAMDISEEAPTSSQALREVYSQEDSVVSKLDFSGIHHKELRNARQYDEINDKYNHDIQGLTAQIDQLAPNMKAIEQFDEVKARLEDTNNEFEGARQNAKELASNFEKIKGKRYRLFMEAFSKVSESIDRIYKDLTRNVGSHAYLTLENLDEPYTEGIKFNAIPPTKRFRDMEQLSGGEKTVAALALLFAIHSYKPSPFFVLDEVDAALDAGNVNNVANYIKRRAGELQCIVISLKDTFFEKADALVGIYKDQRDKCSRTLTWSLEDYDA